MNLLAVGRRSRRALLCSRLIFIAACAGCSSSLPSESTVVATTEKYIDQTLDGIGYTGPRSFEIGTGQCYDTDSAHGAISMIFGFPSLPTLAAGEALMAKLVAYWRSNPTFGNVQASTPSVHQTASVDAPGITLVANADQPYDVDNVTIRVNTCFNSPGPTNPTQTEVGDPPSG